MCVFHDNQIITAYFSIEMAVVGAHVEAPWQNNGPRFFLLRTAENCLSIIIKYTPQQSFCYTYQLIEDLEAIKHWGYKQVTGFPTLTILANKWTSLRSFYI